MMYNLPDLCEQIGVVFHEKSELVHSYVSLNCIRQSLCGSRFCAGPA